MKLLLLPLLALIVLPPPVYAESYWLIIVKKGKGGALEKIEMPNIQTCESEGEKWREVNKMGRDYSCIIGK